MSIQIKLKNSVVQDSTPSASDLPEVGELAVNGNINSIGGFMRASNNTIVKIFGPGSVTTPTATTTVSGISELATNSETTTGTATNRVVTPAGLNAVTVAERTTSNTNYVAKAGSTLTGVLTMPNGSNSAPAINFGDSDSGIFGGTNTVSLAAGGTTRLTADTGVSVVGTLAVTGAITSTDDLTIPDKIIHSGDTDTAVRFPAADTVSVETGANEAFRVDSSQRLLVGTTSSTSIAGFAHRLQVVGTNVSEVASFVSQGNFNGGCRVALGSARNNTIVQDNDQLGEINFFGHDGVDLNTVGASIEGLVDGTPGENDMPGRLVFSTTADGAASPTERLRIDSSGNVGIGTASPGETLHILKTSANHGIKLERTTSNAGSVLIQCSSFGVLALTADNNIQYKSGGSQQHIFYKGSDEIARFDTSKRLLIGTSASLGVLGLAAQLQIAGSTAGGSSLALRRFGDSAQGAFLTFSKSRNAADGSRTIVQNGDELGRIPFCMDDGTDLAHAGAEIRANVDGTPGANDTPGRLVFLTTPNGSATLSERMRIDSSGNVGIGTASPQRLLHQHVSSSAANYHSFTNSTTGSGAANGLLIGLTQDEHGIVWNYSDQPLRFATNNSERMRIDSSGNVGIGTTSPATILHISQTNPELRIQGTNGNGGVHKIFSAGVNSESLQLTGASNLLFNADTQFFRSSDEGTEYMRIDSSGRVGINRTSPTAKLHIVESTSIPAVKIKQGLNSNQNAALQFFNDNGTGTLSLGVFGSAATTFGANEASDGFITANNQLSINAQNSSGQIRFGVGSTPNEKMRIDSAGRVGIGTTNIGSHQLVVEGGKAETGGSCLALKTAGGASGTLSALALYGTFVSPTSDTATRRTADITSGFATENWGNEFLAFHVGKGGASNDTQEVCDERIRITGAGDLVLNSTTARVYNGHTPRLSVQGTDFSSSTVAIMSNSSGVDGAYLFFAKQRSGSVGGSTSVANGDFVGQLRYLAADGTDVQSEVANISVNIDGAPGSNDTPGRITFATTNDGGNVSTERMRISSTGAVGIGTTSPNYILHAKGGIVDQTARFDNTKTGDNDINYIGVGLNTTTTGAALFGHTGHSTAAFQAAWMGVAGDDVAGGTGVKAFKGGTIQMNGVLNIGNNNQPRFSGARIATSSGSFGALFETTGNTAANGIPLIVNRQADNGVMIEFKVANNVVATILRNSNNLMVYGGTSDYRLKENNVAISDSLTKVKSLKPYEFNWKDLPDTKVLGFIAHELQEVVPQAVTGTKDEMYEHDDTKPKYQNVDNSHIVPLLVAALQEAISKIETLETKVAALEAA